MPLEEGNTPWFHFDPVLFLPLWIGLWRWGAYLILKAIPSLLYKPIPISEELEQGHVPVSTQMMTMIIPVYMPEPGFEECLQSWVDNRPKTIVVVVDTNSYQQVGPRLFLLLEGQRTASFGLVVGLLVHLLFLALFSSIILVLAPCRFSIVPSLGHALNPPGGV